ncbi:MAG TPA: TrkH family potassium uptake protein [Alphaproteobacteria bacterium]|nr:TrkH family potassium uptake protein [Alphaproteobacteria bacterium]
MHDYRPVFFVLGILLSILAVAMLVPALVDAGHSDPDWAVFAGAAGVTGFFGSSLMLATRTSRDVRMTIHHAFLLTALSWIGLCLFAALPFYFSSLKMDYADSFFESVSGLTTTGSTVISGLDAAPRGILLWRAILHWLGGIGIIAMAIAILPMLRVGGMQLFRMESSDRSDKVMPRATQLAGTILNIYLGLSVICTAAYWAAGMSFFDAICHMMASLSTGGFSTSDSSIGKFDSPLIDMLVTLFTFLGALTFPLYITALQGRLRALWESEQIRGFVAFTAAVTLSLTLWQWLVNDMAPLTALRYVLFSVVSIITTTGFATTDYSLWGGFPVAVFFFLTFVGGCTGSTTGGIKIFRFQVLYAVTKSQIRRLLQPHGVFVPMYQKREVTETVALSVLTFVFIYMLIFAILSMALGLFGLDFITATSSAATAISNVGPGLGEIVGPAGNFTTIPDGAKLLLAFGMLLGRLEFMALIVVLTPWFWRH